jgi:hypothetical protein
MYFDYTSAQNYSRTLTQGVALTDGGKLAGVYQRVMTMTAKGATLLGHGSNYFREDVSAVSVTGVTSRFRGFLRLVTERLKVNDPARCCRDIVRTITLAARSGTREQRKLSSRRDVADHAGTGDSASRERGFIRTVLAMVSTGDYAEKVSAWFRTIQEQAATLGEAGRLGDYLRGLYSEAGSMEETKHEGEYYRTVQDTAGSMGVSLRRLFIFLRLATLSLVRDYLISRFLRSREELVIKSAVARELILESRVG